MEQIHNKRFELIEIAQQKKKKINNKFCLNKTIVIGSMELLMNTCQVKSN